MGKIKSIFKFISGVYDEFLYDKGFKMAAALSYYTLFSLSPLLIIVLSITGSLWGSEAVRTQLISETTKLLGTEGAKFIDTLLSNINQSEGGIIANITSPIILLLGSIGVFLELKESLNIIWGVEPRPGAGFWGLIKARLYLIPMVLALGFLFVVSLLLNTVISLLMSNLNIFMPEFLKTLDIAYNITQFIVTAIFFTLIFKYLPDVNSNWKDPVRGALFTTILFSIGKFLIGLYLGNSALSSTYGTAASAIILLIWIYYTGVIIYIGAEFMYLYAVRIAKHKIPPQKNAIKIPKTSKLVEDEEKSEHRSGSK